MKDEGSAPQRGKKEPHVKKSETWGCGHIAAVGNEGPGMGGLDRRGHKSKREVVRLWTSEARGASLQRGGTSTPPHVYWEPWEGSGLSTGQALVDPLQVWGLG